MKETSQIEPLSETEQIEERQRLEDSIDGDIELMKKYMGKYNTTHMTAVIDREQLRDGYCVLYNGEAIVVNPTTMLKMLASTGAELDKLRSNLKTMIGRKS